MNLSKQFQWLALEDGPRHLLKAIELYGTKEVVGVKHNPIIMGWAKEIGVDSYYKSDEIPWCGLFIATIIKRAGRIPVKDPLRALSWAEFGIKSPIPMLGDVLTFKRDGGGHVGLYIGENDSVYYVLGGNQGNAVSIVPIAKTRLFEARRPEYISPPLNIRKVQLEAGGKVSINEA